MSEFFIYTACFVFGLGYMVFSLLLYIHFSRVARPGTIYFVVVLGFLDNFKARFLFFHSF